METGFASVSRGRQGRGDRLRRHDGDQLVLGASTIPSSKAKDLRCALAPVISNMPSPNASFLHGSFCATHWHLSQPDGRRERTRHNRKALGPLAPDGARQFPVRHLPLTHEFIARMPCVRRLRRDRRTPPSGGRPPHQGKPQILHCFRPSGIVKTVGPTSACASPRTNLNGARRARSAHCSDT